MNYAIRSIVLAILLVLTLPMAFAGGFPGFEPEFQVTVIEPNGGETLEGTEQVIFIWRMSTPGRYTSLVADVYYSQVPGNFEHLIESNFNVLDASNCRDFDDGTFEWQRCYLSWDTTDAENNKYFLDIRLWDDSRRTWEDSSDNFFMINNSPPSPPRTEVTPGFDDLIEIIPEYRDIYMENNDTVGVAFTLENVSDERQCLTLRTRNYSRYIDTSVHDDEFCLNPHTRTSKTMNITASYAPSGTYRAEFIVKVDVDGYERTGTAFINAHVGEAASIEILPSYSMGTVCRGQSDDLFFSVKNHSYEMKEVELSVSGDFLPTLEEDEIIVDGKESYATEVHLYAPTSTALEEFDVTVSARTDDAFIQRTLNFRVEDCSREESNVLFALDTPSACAAVNKDTLTNVQFSVENKTDDVLTVYLQTISDIWSSVENSIELEEGAEEQLYVSVKPVLEDATGEHIIKVVGWTENKPSIMKELCVTVEEQNHAVLSLMENNLEVEQGEQVIFVLTVNNDGDTDLHYTLDSAAVESGLSVSISDDDFILEPNRQKEVFVSVTASEDAEVKDYGIELLVEEEALGVTEKELNLTVKERTVQIVKLDSFPYKVNMQPSESRVINFSVTNLSNVDFENVKVSLVDLPNGVTTSMQEFSLERGKTIELAQQLNVSEDVETGLYQVQVLIEADEISEERDLLLYIYQETQANAEADEEETGLDMTAGFASLAGNAAVGIFLLLIVLILGGALAYHSRQSNGKPTKKTQAWVKKRKK